MRGREPRLRHRLHSAAESALLPVAGRVTRWFEMPVRQRMQGWPVGLTIVARLLLDASAAASALLCSTTRSAARHMGNTRREVR
jgi:hypothetical protein